MRKLVLTLSVVLAFALGLFVARVVPQTADAKSINPSTGFNVHIDALKHFGSAHPNEVAHHWCKTGIAGGLIECLIFDSDSPNARLVEVETIVGPNVYKTFTKPEQALWHWHKKELAIVHATTPDMTAAQTAAFVKAISPTYGKIWMLWDPQSHAQPTGTPQIVVLPMK